ncbi:hypothetical protein Tco_0369401 [Tanacetum coccineum]
MQNTILNLYPTSSITSSLTATMLTADLQYLLPLNIKSKPQDQATDPELWEILKAKFDKPYILLNGEKRAKRYFGNYKKADEMVRIVREWKTNSIDDEVSIIINP